MAEARDTGPAAKPGETPSTRLEREISEQMSEPPGQSVRNINHDVHLGHAAQRPYARLEDQMASLTEGYASYEDLQAALPEADGPIEKGPDGVWTRTVYVATDQRREVAGEIQYAKAPQKRAVALTQAQALTASDGGVPTDYYNGFSWVREGKKSERDFQVMQQTTGAQPKAAELQWEPLDPMSQSVVRAQVQRGQAASPEVVGGKKES